MRRTLILILTLTIALLADAQKFQFSVDTFYAANGYGATRLLLSSDNNFFIAESNCTEASVARGKWTNKNGIIKLLPYNRDSNFIKPKIAEGNLSTDDTSLILQVVDCFNRTIPYYSIFISDYSDEGSYYYADSTGIIKLNKTKSKLFFTNEELAEFDFRNNLLDYMHPFINNSSSIIIQFNYPKEFFRERPNVRSFEYKGAEFIKKRKGLEYKNSDIILSRL